MKNLFFRGFLTLCLMTLSLMALSAGISAKAAESSNAGQSLKKIEDYTDSGDIQFRYREAVAVISAIKVMDGYKNADSEGLVSYSFRPQGDLTRGAAAKIIANLAITPEDGEWYKKVIEKTPFLDVNKEHVFSSHISYCFQQNLISGYETHEFKPGNPLTYNAFLKMLLCVLGHDQYAEGYTGAQWQERVQTDARKNGLLERLPEDFVISEEGGHAIPREVAALFAFNALLANQVDYSNEDTMPRIVALGADRYANIRDAKVCNLNGDPESQLVQFGEERFPDLRRTIISTYDDTVIVAWSYLVKTAEGEEERQIIGSYSNANPFRDYIVSFDNNNGSDAPRSQTKTVTNGGIYGGLPTPEQTGYGFEGWFTSSYGGEEVTSFSPVWLDGDLTLYAHWTLGQYYAYFRGNGGSVSRDSVAIPANGVLRGLPKPVRDGYAFIGWYTDSQGGEQIRNNSKVSPSSSITLYAHWKANRYRVTFKADGVKVTPSQITVRPGETYGELPQVAPKNGVSFSGWYTAPDGSGQKIEETTLVRLSDNQTLYAYWTSATNGADAPRSHTVTFRADGLDASKLPPPVTLSPGEQLQELPNLDSDGVRNFLGWTYNGAQVSLPLTAQDDMELYALWSEPLSCEDFSYGFDNSAKGFDYAAGVDTRKLIPGYKIIFGNNALANQIYLYDVEQNGFEWRGNCYGMSTTAGMFQYFDNDIHIADFAEPERGLKKPAEIDKLTDDYFHRSWADDKGEPITLKKFIEAMQVSQKTVSFVKTYWENAGSLNKLCEEVARVSETNGGAVVICIYSREAGHALLGYYLEERDSHTSRVHVYDSNFPGQTRYLTLTKDNNGNYISWSYDDAREYNTEIVESESEGTLIRWGSGNDGTITYIPYEKYHQIWQRRGNQDISMNLLTTDLTDATLYDSDGRKIASFRNGEIENPDDVRRNGVYPLVDLEENPSNSPRKIAVWLPDLCEYRIQNDAAYPAEQKISLSNAERSVSVTTTARVVTLSVDAVDTRQANQSEEKTNVTRENQKEFILRAVVEGADAALQIRVDGVSLPPRVDAPASPDKSVTWSGSTRSQMELTLKLLYDGTIIDDPDSPRIVSDGETNRFTMNGEDMTERLKNASNGKISFDNVFN